MLGSKCPLVKLRQTLKHLHCIRRVTSPHRHVLFTALFTHTMHNVRIGGQLSAHSQTAWATPGRVVSVTASVTNTSAIQTDGAVSGVGLHSCARGAVRGLCSSQKSGAIGREDVAVSRPAVVDKRWNYPVAFTTHYIFTEV